MFTASTMLPSQLYSFLLTSSPKQDASMSAVPARCLQSILLAMSQVPQMIGPALVYFVAEKMSSNFFFRVWPSARGQLESS